METPCCNQGCVRRAEFFCRQCESCTFFCSIHGYEHRKETQHDPEMYIIEIGSNEKKMIISQIMKALNNLALLSNDIQWTFSKIVQSINIEFQKINSFISNIKANLLSMISNISNFSSSHILKSEYEFLSSFSLSNYNFQYEIPANLPFTLTDPLKPYSENYLKISQKLYETLYSSDLLSSNLSIIENYKSSYKLIKKQYFLQEISINPSKESDDIGLFFPNDSSIVYLDTNSWKKTGLVLNEKVIPNRGSAASKRASNYWFYSYCTECYFLELNTKVWTKFTPARQRYTERGSVCTNSGIYLFGGVGGEYGEMAVVENEKYNLQKNTWNPIAFLPRVFEATMAGVVDGSIYVLGFKSKELLRYDEGNNSFSVVSCIASQNCCKVICGRWVLVKGSQELYEINEGIVTKKNINTPWKGDVLAIGCCFERGNFYYFIQWNGELMRFDTISLSIERINYT
ncbi:hypothetical protein SteCoe_18653 [Stentor coeruleus]|uniref:Uncharacterized protein n=1 Tax=Stentor coeruleus TaxID=5963 RepID=A0A1R2BWM6_9CILI|nr:hypothetical protein SteCoe_18653 [Stentor coeruleus]